MTEDHLSAGLAAGLAGDTLVELRELREALRTEANTPEDEVQIRYFLGEALTHAGPQGSVSEVLSAPEFAESIEQMERALAVDRTQNVGYFVTTLNRGRLRKLDLSYALMVEHVLHTRGYPAARAYVDQKLSLVSHLPSPPFVHTLGRATTYASEAHDSVAARRYCEILANSHTVVPGDEGEQRIRDAARADLRPSGGGGCFVATVIYGPCAPELSVLRRFRDVYLLRSTLGRICVRIYYHVGPIIASIVKRQSVLFHLTRFLLDRIVRVLKVYLRKGTHRSAGGY